MGTKKRVAVIGAGASGITAIKSCIDDGLEPVCFERTDHIGGLWYYTDESSDGISCVMKSTIINTSKEMMCYSDYPIPKEFPNYMHNTRVVEYFNMYVDHFDLKKYIKFKTQILSVKRAPDYEETGRWGLKIKDLVTEKEFTEMFDAVLLCSGHHADKNMSHFEGQEDFKGSIVHTHDYKSYNGYEDKNIAVVGIGNSGADVACELGKVSKKVYLVTRSGCWIFKRVGDYGMPIDFVITTRLDALMRKILPTGFFNSLIEGLANKVFDHELYGLRPKHRILNAHPTISDDLPNRIISGCVVVKPNIKKIYENSIEFEDGTIAEDIDGIVLATGYKFGFPFLEKGVIDVKENKAELYNYVFPVNLKHPTIAAIGFIQPWGAIMPVSEAQCRWACKVFKGECKLPSNQKMTSDVREKADEMDKRYVKSTRHTIQVDYVAYMDELCSQIGCTPDIKKLVLADPVLAWRVFFEPCTPYQYRLHGPHPWFGARDAIMTQIDRARHPFKTRTPVMKEKGNSTLVAFFGVLILAVLVYLFFF